MSINFKILFDKEREIQPLDYCFIFLKGKLLFKKEKDELRLPAFYEVEEMNIKYEKEFFIGELEKKSCFTMEAVSEIKLLEDFQLLSLRDAGELINEELFLIAGRASQILNWDKNYSFCGKCGTKTEDKIDEMAKFCPNCHHVMYPVICPAIIVGITKGDKLLLAKNSGFTNNMYSLIAGFVEVGEDLNSAVKREVFEEVGLKIKNIQYYKSCPWPFPNSLMLGFFAEYESGEIKVDGKEIIDANWFTKEDFPNIPKKFSLARKIIDEFVNDVK